MAGSDEEATDADDQDADEDEEDEDDEGEITVNKWEKSQQNLFFGYICRYVWLAKPRKLVSNNPRKL